MRGSDRPDRLNRTLLTVLGAILLAAGAYGLARSLGAFGQDQARDPLLLDSIRNFAGRNGEWFWPVVAVVCLILAYLAYRWLRAQIRPGPRLGYIDLPPMSHLGRTRVTAGAATAALAADIESYPEVQSASARLLADGSHPDVDVRVNIFDDADSAQVRRRIEERAFPRFRQALEAEDLRAHVRIGLSEPAGRFVE